MDRFFLLTAPGLVKISIISTFSKSPISGTVIFVAIITVLFIPQFNPLFSHVNIHTTAMTLILENLGKLFEPKYKNLDGKFWIQKVILKKYLKKN